MRQYGYMWACSFAKESECPFFGLSHCAHNKIGVLFLNEALHNFICLSPSLSRGSYEIMLAGVKKYSQFFSRRDFGPTFTKKVGLKKEFKIKTLFSNEMDSRLRGNDRKTNLDSGIRRNDKL
jgi:hypothetical protein